MKMINAILDHSFLTIVIGAWIVIGLVWLAKKGGKK